MTSQIDSDAEERATRLANELDMDSPDRNDWAVLQELYRQLREVEPVKRVKDRGRGNEWFVSRYADVQAGFHDDATFSSCVNTIGGIPGPFPTGSEPSSLGDVDPYIVATHSQKVPLALDPPEHQKYRSLLNPLFSPRRTKSNEWITRETVREHIARIAGQDEADFSQALADPVPSIVVCRLLGLPAQEWEHWASSTPGVSSYSGGDPNEMAREAVMARVFPPLRVQMAMLQVAAERRQRPRDDIITAVAHLTKNGGQLLNFYEIAATLSTVLSGGAHTTTLSIEAALDYLGRHRDVYDYVVADLQRVRPFAEEVLRLWPPLQNFSRSVTRDVELAGQQLKAGDTVWLGIGAANRDAEVFPDADSLVPDRHPNRHVTFTTGIHRCIGSSVARQELVVAVEEVLTSLPKFTIDEERTNIPPSFLDGGDATHRPRQLTAIFDK